MRYSKFHLLVFAALILLINSCYEAGNMPPTPPIIESISPDAGTPGYQITIRGSNFGEFDKNNCRLWIGNLEINNRYFVKNDETYQWIDNRIKFIIPIEAKTDSIFVQVGDMKSNGKLFTRISAIAPTNIRATSIDDKTVSIKWDKSQSENDRIVKFKGYRLFSNVKGNIIKTEYIYDAGTSKAIISNLVAGTVYTFTLTSKIMYQNMPIYSEPVSINWSPAYRFDNNTNGQSIKIYESASVFGSGLELYNTSANAPKTWKVSDGDNWDLGLFTKDGTITFGSASSILAKYSNFSGTTKRVEISSIYYKANSLDDVYDSQALDQGQEFSEQTFNLANLDEVSGLVFIVRTNFPEWNYAKVLIKNTNGFLQGIASDKYIECEISYQKEHIPYAF